jgi:hypothetical protein
MGVCNVQRVYSYDLDGVATVADECVAFPYVRKANFTAGPSLNGDVLVVRARLSLRREGNNLTAVRTYTHRVPRGGNLGGRECSKAESAPTELDFSFKYRLLVSQFQTLHSSPKPLVRLVAGFV